MKYNKIFNVLIIGAVGLATVSCDENSWNDHALDGFEKPDITTPIENIDYTLKAEDYTAIASLSEAVSMVMDRDGINKSQAQTKLNNWAKLGYFNDEFQAKQMLPIYFNANIFPYFAASDKSTIKAFYSEQVAADPMIDAIYNAKVYAVTTDNYMQAWGTPNAFTDAFTPKTPASASLPNILKGAYPDAASGDYVLVNYKQADAEPTFEAVSLTAINKVTVGTNCTVSGTITAICAQGYILTDNTGSLLVYYGKNFVAADYKIGMDVQISGSGSQYNGGLQLAPTAGSENIVSSNVYTYPTPVAMDGAKMNELRDAILAGASKGVMPVYVEFDATVISTGNYTNFTVEGGETTGSAYQPTDDTKAMFVKGEKAKVNGYALSVNTDRNTGAPTYVNFVITAVNGKATAEMAPVKPYVPAPAPIDSYAANALYSFNGTAWSAVTATYLVSPAELQEMGITNGYIANATAYHNIPVLLKAKFPYATEGTTKFVAYQSGAKYANCAQFDYNGSEWIKYDNLVEQSSQYAKVNGHWIFNPNVIISIPNVRQSEPGLTFYQTTVDWVKDNEGSGYIDRGNSEFFSGCSAYYCNINHDISQVEKYAASMYPDLTQSVVIPLMRDRFLNITMPATLSLLYPDANLIEGYDDPIIYEIDYVTYYGNSEFDGKSGNVNDTVKYEVTGPAQFKLVYSTWRGGAIKE